MMDKALKQTDSKLKGTPINVSADPVSDTLLLAASREDMDVLERWVEILDRPSEVGRMTRIIPLQRAVAEDVAKAVTDIYKKQGGGSKTGEIDITVSSDKTSNSVVAFGSPALVADIEGFVRQYDTVEAQKGAIIRIFKLSQADAQEAGDLLGRILDLRSGSVGGTGGGGGSSGTSKQESAKQVLLIFQRLHPEIGMETLKAVRSDIVVISDLRTNSLIVAAPPDSMPLMESLVAAVDVPPEAARIRVFRLRNSDAEQMVKMLGDLFAQKSATTTSGGRTGGAAGEAERVLTLGEGGEGGGRQEIAFATDVRTNSVIAAGTPGYLDLVEQMVLELDTVPIQDREVLVYSPKNNKADIMVPSIKEFSDAEQKRLTDIGKDVSMGVKQERQITAIANKDANRIILSVDPRFKDTVMRVVNDLDQPPPQVLIQVLIVEVTMDNELDLGIEFAFQDLQWAKAGASSTSNFDYVGGTDIGAAGSGLGGFTFTITGADFNFLFRTLQNEGNLNVLSRPQIVAMDNQKAKIDISDDVPYVTGTQTSITGQISTSVNRTKVGITLEVTPQINPDGFVRLEIDQKVSDRTGSTVDVGPGVTSPIFFTREAQTTVMVEDNETVLLGGLITSRAENREQKVPLVGDIPALGLLFRNQSDTTRRTELLLVLTPHVIRSPEEYHEHSIVERDNHRLLPEDVLRDSLMQGLRLEPETPMKAEGAPVKPVSDENVAPVQESLEPKEEEYGPVRPALRVPPPGNPDSYDVPVTARVPAQP
jgi:type II secretion system protein D